MPDVTVKIEGLDETVATLKGLTDKLRGGIVRNALAAGARIVRDAAKDETPTLKTKARYRRPGTVKNAISVRTSKVAKANGDVGVFVNVKPAKGADRGAKTGADPYFWAFVEFGTGPRYAKSKRGKSAYRGVMPAFEMLQKSAEKFPEALEVIEKSLGDQIKKLNVK